MKIKIQKISEDAVVPNYAKAGDAGFDIYSSVDEAITPGEMKRISAGIKMEIPDGYVGLVWDKSGVAFNNGVKTMAGVIDSGYRGEILIVLKNLSEKTFEIKKGQKIAQMLIQKIESPEIEVADSLGETERGDGGFGSTGV
ncbi:deoxyuridine 5'-triphosphate nucleotidohydrolase [Candidatus Campbellbacteria bacterium RIFOXYC2_FULL_35_25]|uniref:dUTP diphosphatase n=1 Tax=Candidatus Campbellbacteria bacterium RIFOXYC2_FULL_35_25 TaxID=1797582 RepID=A0A1F5EIQ3_9BACT|nr:MAG: deoxyuridine 5'-triphosphate nucleotidohydrolase [Candidatus Campbellbacteria bacterium RIFOXYC2_FULL_35_25]